MISAYLDVAQPAEVAWFCIRSRPKQEHITAAYLREDLGVEVYLPRVRFRRKTQTGPKWCTEALFPNYLFARFVLSECFRQVHHGHGARGIVHFGSHWPTIPDSLIGELRRTVQDERPYVLREELQAGDRVVISGGPLHDLEAVVTRIMPGKMRAAVLLEFLGRQTTVEVETEALLTLKGCNRTDRTDRTDGTFTVA
jgi:transcriptional antiterminator RfaH